MEQVVRQVRLLRFGVYEIDFDAGELRKDGHKVPLQEQPFQVLALLLVSPGKLVTREELQKRLWAADTFVDFDLGLNTAIKKIRAALGDSADNPRFVQTLPRRGYRFICPVEEVTPAAPLASPNGSASSIPTGGIATGSIATDVDELPSAPASLGVKIPGKILGTAKSSYIRLWLALGLLAVVLVAGLSFLKFRSRSLSHLSLNQRPASEDRAGLGGRGTRSSAAWGFYSEGRSLLQADDLPDSTENAIQAFNHAVAADDSYALAYGGLAEAYMRKYKTTEQEEWLTQARDNCQKALNLDSSRPAGYLCHGFIDAGLGLYKEAVKDFSDAIKIDDSNEGALLGRAGAYKRGNKIAEAKQDYLKVIQLAPENWRGYAGLARLDFDAGRYAEAAEGYRKASEIKPDDGGLRSSLGAALMQSGDYGKAVPELLEGNRLKASFQTYENLGTIYLFQGRFEESIANFKKALQPDEYLGYGNMGRFYYWATSQRDLARKNYEQAIRLAEQKLVVNPDDPDVNLMLGVYHAMLGEENLALLSLNRAQQVLPDGSEVAFWGGVVHLQLKNRPRALALLRHARFLGYSAAEMNAAPELKDLRGDPEFQQFMSAGSKTKAHNSNPEPDRRTK